MARFLLLAICGLVAGERVLETTTGRKTRVEPRVNVCDPLCVFEDKTNKWCFYTLDPTLRLGWEWNQVYGTTQTTDLAVAPIKYWQLELGFYADSMFYFETILDISRAIFIDFIADMQQFKWKIFGSFIWTHTGRICPGIGYSNEKVGLVLSLEHGFMDCAKALISNICNPASEWTGIDAKIFSKCAKSKRTKLTLRSWVFQLAQQNMMLLGTTMPTSVTHCSNWFGDPAETTT